MKKIAREWGGAVVVYIGLILFIIYCFFLFMPMSFWVEYESVMPVKKEFKIGEQLQFISKSKIARATNLEFSDILYCKNGLPDSYVFYSSYNTCHKNAQKTNGYTFTRWNYGHAVTIPTECYLVSNITIILPWGIEKTKKVIGPKFQIVEE